MTIAKKCIGCNSNRTIFKLIYYQCKTYLSSKDIYLHTLFMEHDLQKKFRDEYCPCTTCLVKATCTDPKMNIPFAAHSSIYIHDKHKCELFNSKVKECQIYIKDYMKDHKYKHQPKF